MIASRTEAEEIRRGRLQWVSPKFVRAAMWLHLLRMQQQLLRDMLPNFATGSRLDRLALLAGLHR